MGAPKLSWSQANCIPILQNCFSFFLFFLYSANTLTNRRRINIDFARVEEKSGLWKLKRSQKLYKVIPKTVFLDSHSKDKQSRRRGGSGRLIGKQLMLLLMPWGQLKSLDVQTQSEGSQNTIVFIYRSFYCCQRYGK